MLQLVPILYYMTMNLVGIDAESHHATVYWHKDNPIFLSNGNENTYHVRMGDSLDFVCPQNKGNGITQKDKHLIIYKIPSQQYQNCNIKSNALRQILNCTQAADRHQKFTMSIRRFTPLPGGMEFVEGQSYYFTSTLVSSENLYTIPITMCPYQNMKIEVKVYGHGGKSLSNFLAPIEKQNRLLLNRDWGSNRVDDEGVQYPDNSKIHRALIIPSYLKRQNYLQPRIGSNNSPPKHLQHRQTTTSPTSHQLATRKIINHYKPAIPNIIGYEPLPQKLSQDLKDYLSTMLRMKTIKYTNSGYGIRPKDRLLLCLIFLFSNIFLNRII